MMETKSVSNRFIKKSRREAKMPVAKLDDLTIEEKISVMEYLWDDLCRHADETLSPSWHGDVLSQREDLVARGESKFIDWHEAKKKIREAL
jgi:hypothetical protein